MDREDKEREIIASKIYNVDDFSEEEMESNDYDDNAHRTGVLMRKRGRPTQRKEGGIPTKKKPNTKANTSTEDDTAEGATTAVAEEESSNITPYEKYTSRICPICATAFLHREDWRKHLKDAHNFGGPESNNVEPYGKNKSKCKQCGTILFAMDNWHCRLHRITHLPYPNYIKCELCLKFFTSTAGAVKHIKKFHEPFQDDTATRNDDENAMANEQNWTAMEEEDDTQPCKIKRQFNAITIKRIIYERHMLRLCPFCGKEFSNRFQWRHHLNQVHMFNNREQLNIDFFENNIGRCRECHKIKQFRQLHHAQTHKITHLPHPRFIKCKLCSKDFTINLNVFLHLEKEHLTVRKQLQALQNTKKDKDTKTDQMKKKILVYVCPKCKKEISMESAWLEHINTEHDYNLPSTLGFMVLLINERDVLIKIYQCADCNKKYNDFNLEIMREHAFNHMEDQFLKCKTCNRLFRSKAIANNHVCRTKPKMKDSQSVNFGDEPANSEDEM